MTPPPPIRTPLFTLMAVMVIANVGTRVSAIAIPWFVLSTTGSATMTGLVAAFELGPYVVAKALGGPITDRVGQRRISMITDTGSALVIGAIPLLHTLDQLPLPALLALVAVGGALRGPGDNGKHTAVPFVTELAHWPLERATGLFGAIERGSGLVAPGVAALMITVASPAGAVGVTAGCFAISALLVATGMPVRFESPRATAHAAGDESAATSGYLSQLAEGFRFLRGDKLLLMLTLMIMVTNLIDVAKTSVLLPVWAQRGDHGVTAMSALLTSMALGSVVSSVLASWLGPRLPRKLTYFASFLIAGPGPYIVLALDWPVSWLMITYVIAGLASGFLNPLLGAIFFERIPRPLLGRVGGLSDAIAWGGMPLGGIVAAALIAGLGLSPAFLVLGISYLIATIIPGLLSGDMFDRRPPQRGHNRTNDRTPQPTTEATTP
ncbi:MAG: MFS transporter [Propionibacteriales bacterium]|nr:MFS transporter [Propionibacteriales bacterium]